jgi:nitrite reductase (NADH) small subunit
MKWETVCTYGRLETERGVAALVGRTQVALFRLHDGAVHAIGNVDPLSGAAVLARGIVGSRGSVPTVASPLYKEVYDLRTGRCLDKPDVAVPVYPVRVRDGLIEIGVS